MTAPGSPELAWLLPEAVVMVDDVGTLTWGNRAAGTLFGLEVHEAVGRHALEFVHPEDVEIVAGALQSIHGKEVGSYLEVRVKAVEGWRLVEVVGADLRHQPEVGGVVLCLRDVTERRRWEVARGDEGRLRALLHHAGTIMLLLDGDACVESVSAAVTRMLGHDQELVEGRGLIELVAEPDRGRVADELAQVSAVPWAHRTIEARLVRRDGDAVPFELHVVNLLEDPTVRGMVVSAHDVTVLRRSMQQLAKMQLELARNERLAAVGQLASMIGHELRNPLTAVTNAHFLVREVLGDRIPAVVDTNLAMAERETGRAVALSQDLLSYVRPRTARWEEVDASEVLSQVFEATPPPPGVEVHRALQPVPMTADPGHLAEMMTNLLVNAYQAMPDGGAVHVELRADDGHMCCTVRDEGPGVDDDVASRVFDPFVTTKPYGTGLGLSIVRRLAEAHGGTVHLRDAEEGGALAELRLVRFPPAARNGDSGSESDSHSEGHSAPGAASSTERGPSATTTTSSVRT